MKMLQMNLRVEQSSEPLKPMQVYFSYYAIVLLFFKMYYLFYYPCKKGKDGDIKF